MSTWDKTEGLIHDCCKKAWKRVKDARLTHIVCYDDLFQEGSIAFLQAKEGFDPERGIQWSTYVVRAIYNQINKLLDRSGLRQVKTIHPSLVGDWVEPQDFNSNPEEEIHVETLMLATLKSLCPKGQVALEMVYDPPEEIAAELEALQAFCERSRKLGHEMRAPTGVSLSFIARRLMPAVGFTTVAEGRRLVTEVKGAMTNA